MARRDCSANKVGKLTGSRPTELVRIVQTYAYFVLWLGLIRLFRGAPVIGDGEDTKNREVFGETGLTRADRLLIYFLDFGELRKGVLGGEFVAKRFWVEGGCKKPFAKTFRNIWGTGRVKVGRCIIFVKMVGGRRAAAVKMVRTREGGI